MNKSTGGKPALRVVPPAAPSDSPLTTPPAGPPTQDQTLGDLLDQSRRGAVPVRKAFVQRPERGPDRAGPLATFVTMHDERGLDLYLFLHALASAAPWTCTYPAETWARVMDLSSTCEQASAKAAVSKVLKRLEDRRLISRRRVGRQTEITLLQDDGTGSDYTRPIKASDGLWLTLPYQYWRDRHFAQLTLAGKAMLLIGLSLPPEFQLPVERAYKWYGISADTAQRGFKELNRLDLLSTSSTYERDHKSPTGWREIRHHRLRAPYDPVSRKAATGIAGGRRTRQTAKEIPGQTPEVSVAT